MSNSAVLKSSIAKKWWMALTGLFLCLFLVGHLLGNLQLFIDGEAGKRAFNEYAYFMTHNPLIKVMSYITYFSILFHAIDGIALTIQNKKARPQKYAYNKPGANSSLPSRYMAVLGTLILVFIGLHMVNFWGKMHFTNMPLHKEIRVTERPSFEGGQMSTVSDTTSFYLTTKGDYIPSYLFEKGRDGSDAQLYLSGTTIMSSQTDLEVAEAYKDLHSLVMAFFGHDKQSEGFPKNDGAIVAVLIYVFSMLVLGFHLWHGFAAAHQTLGINSPKFNGLIKGFGKAFAVIVPLAFAAIPLFLFFTK
jgi:succinate dehydrogenase / fumarate reductase cytochrome b subunit